jgi:hypothetical protein
MPNDERTWRRGGTGEGWMVMETRVDEGPNNVHIGWPEMLRTNASGNVDCDKIFVSLSRGEDNRKFG